MEAANAVHQARSVLRMILSHLTSIQLTWVDLELELPLSLTSYVLQAYDIFPLSDILPKQSSLLLTDTSHNPPLPLALRIGDANLDGFPDILAVVVGNPSTNRMPVLLFNVHKSLRASSSSSMNANTHRSFEQNSYLQRSLGLDTRISMNTTGDVLVEHSVPDKSPRRAFRAVKDGAGPLHDITDARGVAFLDLDEDVSFHDSSKSAVDQRLVDTPTIRRAR